MEVPGKCLKVYTYADIATRRFFVFPPHKTKAKRGERGGGEGEREGGRGGREGGREGRGARLKKPIRF